MRAACRVWRFGCRPRRPSRVDQILAVCRKHAEKVGRVCVRDDTPEKIRRGFFRHRDPPNLLLRIPQLYYPSPGFRSSQSILLETRWRGRAARLRVDERVRWTSYMEHVRDVQIARLGRLGHRWLRIPTGHRPATVTRHDPACTRANASWLRAAADTLGTLQYTRRIGNSGDPTARCDLGRVNQVSPHAHHKSGQP